MSSVEVRKDFSLVKISGIWIYGLARNMGLGSECLHPSQDVYVGILTPDGTV